MAKILIPTALRQFTGQQDSVDVAGNTVGEALKALTEKFPDVRKNLFNDQGKLRSFVNVYVNDEDIRFLGGDSHPFEDGDEVMLIPSIAGGRCGNRRFRHGCRHARPAGR